MKKLAILILALELAVCGCGTGTTANTTTNTAASGNWEVQLIGGKAEASKLNFVTAFSVTNSGPLDITGFGFINAGKCFANGVNGSTQTGTATLITSSANTVTGTLNFAVTSVIPAGNALVLTNVYAAIVDATPPVISQVQTNPGVTTGTVDAVNEKGRAIS